MFKSFVILLLLASSGSAYLLLWHAAPDVTCEGKPERFECDKKCIPYHAEIYDVSYMVSVPLTLKY